VDCEDIAEIVFAALTTPDHSRKLYEVTGPQSLTFPEAIEEIARMTGRRIDFVPVTPEEYRKGMEQAGVPADFAELAIFLFTTLFDGRNSRLTDGVQQALGRPPRSFSEYVRKTVESGIWNPAD
jgi:uncharacterized protein YbjT (DUF2867 family)